MTRINRAAHRPAGTAPARIGQIAGAFAIDTAVLAVLAAVAVSAGNLGAANLATLAALALIAFVIAQVVAWSRTGRTLGLSITGVRQVTTFDGAPPGFDRALGSTWYADVRRARDPVQPESIVTPRPPQAPPGTPVGAPPSEIAERSTSRALLVVDGRVGGAIGEGVVLGRNPTAVGRERAVSVADIGRELSKVHLAVRVDGAGRVWAVDQKSTNGSTVTRRDGRTQSLPPGKPVEIAPGDIVHIGNHTVSVQFVTEVSVATR